MRTILILAGAALIAAPAGAQLLGGQAGVGAVVGAQPGAAGSTLGGTVDGARGLTNGVAGTAGDVAEDAGSGKVVRVKAGARVRATREARCYDGTNYYDPYYGPDGYYYCESSGPGAAAGAGVGVGGR